MTEHDVENITLLVDKLAEVMRSYRVDAYHIEVLTLDENGTIDQFLAKGKVSGTPDRFTEMRATGQRLIKTRGYGTGRTIKQQRCQSDH